MVSSDRARPFAGPDLTGVVAALLSLLVAVTATAASEPAFPRPFDIGARYSRGIHVDAAAPPGGDGSAAAPFRMIAAALAKVQPGTRVLVARGTYGPVGSVRNLQGRAGAPIALVGAGGVVIDAGGKGSGLHLADPQYLVIENIAIRNAVPHGISIDDDGAYSSPARHIALRGLAFSRIGDGGNNDCLKMSGVDDFYIEGSRFAGCNQGEGIDMVGCHRGTITGNTFTDMPGIAVQTKGGSADVLIHGNRFVRIGGRAINAGGSTGEPWFRPLDAPHEAERIRMIANLIKDTGSAPVTFSGCSDCVFANSTIVDPGDYAFRIVEENPARLPGERGYFINNIIVFDARTMRSFVDIRKGTKPGTFIVDANLWHPRDDPSFGGPELPRDLPPGRHAVTSRDPMLDGDLRPQAGSPAIAAGRAVPGGLPGDFERRPYRDPPAVGALSGP